MARRIVVVTDLGEVLTEVAIAALTTEPELQAIGKALIGLVRYHDQKTGSVES